MSSKKDDVIGTRDDFDVVKLELSVRLELYSESDDVNVILTSFGWKQK